jgi:hypothetical protein
MSGIESSGSIENPDESGAGKPWVDPSDIQHPSGTGAEAGAGFGEITSPYNSAPETSGNPDDTPPETPSDNTPQIPPVVSSSQEVSVAQEVPAADDTPVSDPTEIRLTAADMPEHGLAQTFEKLASDDYWGVPSFLEDGNDGMEKTPPLRVLDKIMATRVREEIRRITREFEESGQQPEKLQPGQSTADVDLTNAVFKVTKDYRLHLDEGSPLEDPQLRQVFGDARLDPLLFDLTADAMSEQVVYDGGPAAIRVRTPDEERDIARNVQYMRPTASGTGLVGVNSQNLFTEGGGATGYSSHLTVGKCTSDVVDDRLLMDRVIASIEVMRVPSADESRLSILRGIARALLSPQASLPPEVPHADNQ